MTIRADRPYLELRRVTAPGLVDVDLAWQLGEALAVIVDDDPAPLLDVLVGLHDEHAGMIVVAGEPRPGRARRGLLRALPEDAPAMLDANGTIGELVGRSLREPDPAAVELAIERVGLGHAHGERRAGNLSSSELNRAALAAVLVGAPPGIIVAEPFATLGAVDRASLLGTLAREHRERGLGLLLLTRSPALAWTLSDRVAVLVAGRLVELGPTEQVLLNPSHPATRDLVLAAGTLTDPAQPPARHPPPLLVRNAGCIYARACSKARPRCATDRPPLGAGPTPYQQVACWYPVGHREAGTRAD